MFKNYLKGIDGIEQYPLLLLLVFFAFFSFTLFYLWKAGSAHFDRLRELPLHDSVTSTEPLTKTTGDESHS
jgi:hypothetical protein